MVTVTFGINLFFDIFAYNRELTATKTLLFLVLILAFFFGVIVCTSVIVHISNVHEKLRLTNEENMKLLNGMHEGILILAKTLEQPSAIMFCNRPAHKLIRTFLDPSKDKLSENNAKILGQQSFYPLNLQDS